MLYSESAWAPGLMALLGGPKTTAFIHRIAAIGFMGVFFVHLVYFTIRIGRNIRTFEWFGPNSLIPGLQDFRDAIAMFQWFLGQGPRPRITSYNVCYTKLLRTVRSSSSITCGTITVSSEEPISATASVCAADSCFLSRPDFSM